MAKISKNISEIEQKEKVDLINNIKIYFKFIGPLKWTFMIIILLISIIEIEKLGERYIFKLVIDNSTAFTQNQIAREVLVSILFSLASIFVTIVLIKLLLNWIRMHLVNKMDSQIIFNLKRKFFNHIIYLSHKFHTTHKTGSLISRLGRGSRAVERMTDFFFFDMSPLIIQVAAVTGTFFIFDKISALIVLLMTISFIFFSIIMSLIQQKSNLVANNSDDKEKGTIADIFMNIDSVKYFGKEASIKNKYYELATKTRDNYLVFWNYARWYELGQGLILAIGTFFLIYFPLKGLINGTTSIGTITFIYTSYIALIGPLFGFVHSLRRMYEALADFQALFNYEKIQNEIKDIPNAPQLNVKEGSISFNNVTFAYHSRKIIDNLSLEVNPGEKIALVGHSGSGKTTLVKLLYRFYDITKGEIKVDDKNIKNFQQESLRGEFSIVPQECILFDDTIYSNIAFSRPQASRKEVLQAIKLAQLDKFISRLPQKENTIVGERGVKLSGGEKQRVSIARALLADKKVLVLDEATSSLDSHTEHEIQEALHKLMQGRTSIIIAHRLSTIMTADRIVVLHKGKIAQIGKHADLIKKSGIYKKLWNLQKGGYIGE
jgi:ATP-binding cassette, subfamily B, heavy metal transporter